MQFQKGSYGGMCMDKNKQVRIILIIGIILLALLLIFQGLFYDYYLMPKRARALDKMYGEMFIKVNERWIDIYHGKINLTEKGIQEIELSLERLKINIPDS